MIQTFVEKNKKLLLTYYWIMRIGGWAFLALVILTAAGKSFALASRYGDWQEFGRFLHHDVPWGTFIYGLPASLLALGFAQFIRYLLEADRRPDWILRNSHKLLYAYTAILALFYCGATAREVIVHFNEPYDFPLRLIMLVLFFSVKLLALVGVAEILKRMLPMLDESRTLV